MTDDPLLLYLVEALNLVHPRFAGVGDPGTRPDHGSFVREFYHQLRRLWDKALPVQLGLGHVMIQIDPDGPSDDRPDLAFWQLGEHGGADRRLAIVSVDGVTGSDPGRNAAKTLRRNRESLDYPHAVLVVVGPSPDRPPAGVTAVIRYDPARRSAAVISG